MFFNTEFMRYYKYNFVKWFYCLVFFILLLLGVILVFHYKEIPIGLALVSMALGYYSLILAITSGRRMKAIANLEFDEKIVMMGIYKEAIINKKNEEIKIRIDLERVKNEFQAVSNLKRYADENRKDKLINEYIRPIIDSIEKDENLKKKYKDALNEIKKIALEFGVKSEEPK